MPTDTVNLAKLFFLMLLFGGAGGALGSMIGQGVGRGGLLIGGVVGGLLLVVAAGFLSARWHWIKPSQRLWAILGGAFGFGAACMVALTTLSSPLGPIASSLLIGTGAVLGAMVGKSPHEQT